MTAPNEPASRAPVTSALTLDVETSRPLPAVAPAADRDGLHVLVRVHGRPVARLLRPVGSTGITAHRLGEIIWEAASDAIRSHLDEDGLPAPETLGPEGLDLPGQPPCERRRAAALAPAPAMSVLISTRDRPIELMRCLRSVAAQDYPAPYDVVVVDSAPSSDDTQRLIEDLGGRLDGVPIRYVREPVPGLGLGHRRGLDVVTGDWVAITDDDVVVDRSWLSAIAEAATSRADVGCVTGLIVPAELETTAQLLLEQQGGFDRGFSPRLVDTGEHRPDDPLFPFTVGRLGSGANMAFETALLREPHAIDPALGAGTPARGGDDLAMLLRILRSGRAVAYQPAAMLWHWHRRDYALLRRQAGHYGVGLGAYLASAVRHDPAAALVMLRRLPGAVRHVLDPRSAKNEQKPSTYPRELDRAERLGMLQGPFRYVLSSWRYRHVLRSESTTGEATEAAA